MPDSAHIIFVDDDEEDHLIILEYFRDLGKEKQIRFLMHGQQVLDHLETIPSESPLPRLIVLDLNMPILDGRETLSRLKRHPRFRAIPVIVLSTSENEAEKQKCLSLGAEAYVVKPATYADGLRMVDTFTRYLDIHGTT